MAPAVPEIHTLRKKGRPVSIGPKTCNTGYTGGPYILFQTVAFDPPNYARFSLCCGTAATAFGTPFDNNQISLRPGLQQLVRQPPREYGIGTGHLVTGGICGNGACTPANDIAVEIYGGSSNYRDA